MYSKRRSAPPGRLVQELDRKRFVVLVHFLLMRSEHASWELKHLAQNDILRGHTSILKQHNKYVYIYTHLDIV